MPTQSADALDHALRLLGPLEGRVMHVVWSDKLDHPFVVADVRVHMPELAYTTVMTTLNRLANKGLLTVTPVRGRRAYEYRAVSTPDEFLVSAGRDSVEHILQQFGDIALAAFSERLDSLSPAQRENLRRLSQP
jgi:predicted transcriptional regulator